MLVCSVQMISLLDNKSNFQMFTLFSGALCKEAAHKVIKSKEAAWPSGQRVGLAIRRSCSDHYLDLFLGSPELNPRPHL